VIKIFQLYQQKQDSQFWRGLPRDGDSSVRPRGSVWSCGPAAALQLHQDAAALGDAAARGAAVLGAAAARGRGRRARSCSGARRRQREEPYVAPTAPGEARAAVRGVPGGGKRGSDGGARGCYGASLFFLCFFGNGQHWRVNRR